MSKSAPPLAKGIIYALVAAALFGARPPLAELLLGELPPVPKAAGRVFVREQWVERALGNEVGAMGLKQEWSG